MHSFISDYDASVAVKKLHDLVTLTVDFRPSTLIIYITSSVEVDARALCHMTYE